MVWCHLWSCPQSWYLDMVDDVLNRWFVFTQRYILFFSYEDAAYRYYRTQCEESSAQRRGKCPENRQRKRRHERLCRVSADIEPFTTINRGNQQAIRTYGRYAVEVSGQCSLYILSSESAQWPHHLESPGTFRIHIHSTCFDIPFCEKTKIKITILVSFDPITEQFS